MPRRINHLWSARKQQLLRGIYHSGRLALPAVSGSAVLRLHPHAADQWRSITDEMAAGELELVGRAADAAADQCRGCRDCQRDSAHGMGGPRFPPFFWSGINFPRAMTGCNPTPSANPGNSGSPGHKVVHLETVGGTQGVGRR